MFEYKMVQVPRGVLVNIKDHKGNEAAAFLQTTVNNEAKNGWEFFRVDELSVATKVGCLASLLGNKGEINSYNVITFRRAIE